MTDWFVYIVQCADETLYTGVTTELDRRVAEHNGERLKATDSTVGDRKVKGKGAAYTASRRPVKLVYVEKHHGRSAACQREAAIKKLTRTQKLNLIAAQPGG